MRIFAMALVNRAKVFNLVFLSVLFLEIEPVLVHACLVFAVNFYILTLASRYSDTFITKDLVPTVNFFLQTRYIRKLF